MALPREAAAVACPVLRIECLHVPNCTQAFGGNLEETRLLLSWLEVGGPYHPLTQLSP